VCNLPPLVDSVQELAALGLVEEASATVRTHGTVPLFKLYLLNGENAFFGFYPVREHVVTIKGEKHPIYDLMGKDTILFHHATSDDDTSTGSQYVEQARTWFESMWNTVARDLTP